MCAALSFFLHFVSALYDIHTGFLFAALMRTDFVCGTCFQIAYHSLVLNHGGFLLRGDTGVKICEILIFYHFCVFGIIIKIKLFTSM